MAARVGALKRFGSVDTSVPGRFNDTDLGLSSAAAAGAPNENIGFGFSIDGAAG